MVVGNGNDWIAQRPSGTTKTIGESTGTFGATGLTSESDSKKGANFYGLQVNSNLGFAVTYYGKATKGWEQFLYNNIDNTGGLVYIEYWLLNYATTYGSCPPASQDPPGGGAGWFNYKGSCYFNTNGIATPTLPAKDLNQITFLGAANVLSGGKDIVEICGSVIGGCYEKTITDTVLHLYKHWTQSEFNVFGYCCGTRANFNTGTTITVSNSLLDEAAKQFGVARCLKGGFTGETNNLNLGSCSSGSTYIRFTESN